MTLWCRKCVISGFVTESDGRWLFQRSPGFGRAVLISNTIEQKFRFIYGMSVAERDPAKLSGVEWKTTPNLQNGFQKRDRPPVAFETHKEMG